MVERYLAASKQAWERFKREYLELLEQRFVTDPASFVDLAHQASGADVYLGCNCPTVKNPDVYRCHTVLALEFMRRRFASLEVRMPSRHT